MRQRGPEFERTIFFHAKDGHERYLVIFGGDLSANIERSYAVVTSTPIVAGPLIFNVVGGQESKGTLRASPVGQVTVSVAMPQESAAK